MAHARALRIPRVDPARFDARHALAFARRLRLALLALCLGAAVIGWLVGSRTIVGLAAVIAAEELLEISVVIGALRLHPGVAGHRPY